MPELDQKTTSQEWPLLAQSGHWRSHGDAAAAQPFSPFMGWIESCRGRGWGLFRPSGPSCRKPRV